MKQCTSWGLGSFQVPVSAQKALQKSQTKRRKLLDRKLSSPIDLPLRQIYTNQKEWNCVSEQACFGRPTNLLLLLSYPVWTRCWKFDGVEISGFFFFLENILTLQRERRERNCYTIELGVKISLQIVTFLRFCHLRYLRTKPNKLNWDKKEIGL